MIRRTRRVRQSASSATAQEYWLGEAEINNVYSPNGANLTYWNINPNLTASYDASRDALVISRNATNSSTWYIQPHVNASKTRYQLNSGQYIVGGADITASHACRVSVNFALYDGPTTWRWIDGNAVTVDIAANQTIPVPIQCNVPTASGQYYLEYSIGFLPQLGPDGTIPLTLPAGATLTIRNAGLFIDQMPLDGLFSASSLGASWQGTANASPSVRRVATPKTHFKPPTSTIDIGGIIYKTAEVATPPKAFTSDSVWNRPASTLTPIADSDQRLRWLAGNLGAANIFSTSGQMGTMWGVPTYYADSTSPSYNVVPKSGNLQSSWNGIRIPVGARAAANDDAEMTVYDVERNIVWWFWQASFTNGVWSAQAASHAYLDGNGIAAGMTNGDPRNTENGHNGKNGHICHWRWNEFATGEVNRVVRIALPNTYGSKQAIWPISYSDGKSTDALAIPQGAILRLKPGININTTFPNVPHFGKIMLRQMQNYGVMYVDSGGDSPGFIIEDVYFESGLARWPYGYSPLPGVKLADSGASDAKVYFDVCYPAPSYTTD